VFVFAGAYVLPPYVWFAQCLKYGIMYAVACVAHLEMISTEFVNIIFFQGIYMFAFLCCPQQQQLLSWPLEYPESLL
jgi:hypothetical protein